MAVFSLLKISASYKYTRSMNVAITKNRQKFLTTKEAAAILGCTSAHVRLLIRDGELEAQREHEGFPYLVNEASVRQYDERSFTAGRPRKHRN